MAIEEKEFHSTSFDWGLWKGLMPYLKPYKKDFIGIFVANVLCALIDVAFPLFQRYAIDSLVGEGRTDGLMLFGISYAALVVLQALTVVSFSRASMRLEMNFGRDLRRAQFVHLQKLSLSYYNATPVGYLLARTMNDTGRISGMIGWSVADLI